MSDSNSTERDDAHAADNVTSPNRNSLTEHTTTINPNSHTTVTQHSDSYSSSLRGYVYVSPENVRGSSLRTDTTTSDLITRPSIDSVDDDEDNRVEGRIGSHGTNSLTRQELFGLSPPGKQRFVVGGDDGYPSEDNDNAFDENPVSSEDNDAFNDHRDRDRDELIDGEEDEDENADDVTGTHRMKYHITLTETDSVFPVNFGPTSSTVAHPTMINGQNYQAAESSSLSRSGASIASSLASFSGNLELLSSSTTSDTVCLALSNEVDSEPAQYVLKMILAQFMSVTNLKIEELLLKDPQFNSCKPLQFGEDPIWDQLLESLYEVSEHSLPSILRGLFHWYDSLSSSVARHQTLYWMANSTPLSSLAPDKQQLILDKRDLYLDFALGMGLLQACKQLEKHPVEEELLRRIEDIPFKHYFKPSQKRRNAVSKPVLFGLVNLVADLYAQLVGELLKTRFVHITSWFKTEFRALKKSEASTERTQCFVYLVMGLRFFRVKMFPIQEFDMCFQFIHELARYFQDPVLCKEKEIRHAFAGLLAEILLPVAAVVKNEVNIPAVKNLVKTYFDSTRQAADKKKHAVAMFPLVTCLLAISHTNFFTQQWTSFVSECIASLRTRDPKITRAALESLYRLLWVYMVRIKEDNVNSSQKLQPIINALFPKNSRNLIPRDMPLMIYVKIIHFIAQEKLDLAMREIVFELLQVSKLPKVTIFPERMIVGIRAFLVIADQLQQQPVEKSPPMPTNSGSLPSGSTQKAKRTFLTHNLTDIAAMNCGLGSYYGQVCKALGVILYHLDAQIGKPMLSHVMSQSPTKEHKDATSALAADKKPKLDLFRTCIAAMPRLLPLPLNSASCSGTSGSQTAPATSTGTISSRNEVLDLLCRLADHSEDELRTLAIAHMGNIIKELRDWRPDVISRLVLLIVREIPDTMPATIESMIRILLQIISKWKECLLSELSFTSNITSSLGASTSKTSPLCFSPNSNAQQTENAPKSKSNSLKLEDLELCASAIRKIEGLALCMLSHLRPKTRNLAVLLLKEAQSLASDLKLPEALNFVPCIVKMDQGLPKILEEMLPLLSSNERFWAATAAQPDLTWLCEKTCNMWCVNANYELSFECVPTSSTLCSSSLLPAGGSEHDGLNQSGISLLKSTAVGIRNSFDPWFYCIIHLMDSASHLKTTGCVEAVNHAWNFASTRVNMMYSLIEQLTPQEFSKATLTRTPKRPNPINDYYLCVWRNYITLCCGGWTSHDFRTTAAGTSHSASGGPSAALTASCQSSSQMSNIESSLHSSPASNDIQNSSGGGSTTGVTASASLVGTTSKVEKRETIGQLLRNVLIPILRGEHIHLKEVTVQAIGFTNSHALKDSVDDFSGLVKEATDRRPDKRRLKKRAELRLMVVRIFSKISERGVISQCLFEHAERTISPRSSSTGNPVAGFFYDLIDSYRQCLDQPNSEMSDSALREAKICYSKLIHFMIATAPDGRTSRTFSSEIQRSLFDSTSAWCGTLGNIANGKSPPSTEQTTYSEVELAALQAMCSVISSEPDERNAFLCEDSYIYTGLQYMLTSRNQQVYNLACGAIEKLFRKNSLNSVILKWLFHQSFELKSLAVSHACFKTIINVCSEMPYCKLQSLDVNAASFVLLALFFADSSDLCIREKALQLLYLLGSKVLGVIDVLASSVDNQSGSEGVPNLHVLGSDIAEEELDPLTPQEEGFGAFGMDESFLAATPAAYYKTQRHLSKELSRTRPELTLGILSEFSCRFEMTSPAGRETLLKCILPWMENVELVEPSFLPAVIPLTPIASSSGNRLLSGGGGRKSPPGASNRSKKASSCKDPALHFTPLSWALGWGSTAATDTILTNLFYVTVQFASEHSDSLRKIWQSLCNSFHDNCAIILRFLLQMVAISSRCAKLLAAAKIVVAFMAKGSKEHVISFLLSELSFIDAIPNSVRKSSTCPYFNVVSGSTGSSNSHSRAKSDSTVIQVPSTAATTIATSTLPASSRVSNNIDAATSSSGGAAVVTKGNKEKHSTLPPDFYQPPLLGPEKSVSVPAVAQKTTLSSAHSHTSVSHRTTSGDDMATTVHSSSTCVVNQIGSGGGSGCTVAGREGALECSGGSGTGLSSPLGESLGEQCHKVSDRNQWLLAWKVSFSRCNERHAKPLPMPTEPFVCPLAKLILTNSFNSTNNQLQTSSGAQNAQDTPTSLSAPGNNSYASGVYALQRCFASLILCSHLLITDFGCDWTPHIPQFLHLSILGLDHGLPVVVSHSRRTLINLVLTQLDTDADVTSKTLLLKSTDLVVSTLSPPHLHRSESEHHEYSFTEIAEDDNPPARLAEYLLQNISQPLWTLEDVSPRNQSITSAEKVTAFVSLLIQVFENHYNGEVPLAYDVRGEWGAISLKMALSSSSRHYASRSFQVFRGLEITPLSSDVSEVLIRLNDTVGEVGEETQGYVVEIMQTLSKMSSLIVDQPEFVPQRPLSLFTDPSMVDNIATSTTNRGASLSARFAKATTNPAHVSSRKNQSSVAAAILTSRRPTELDVFYRRTASYNGPAAEALRMGFPDNSNTTERVPAMTGPCSTTLDTHQRSEIRRRDLKARSQCLPRDFGDTLLSRRGGHGIFDDKLSLLCQIFWAVVSMLESDFEYEYVLALKLLDQLLSGLKMESSRHQNALCRVFHQMKWSVFSGLQPLVLKGLTLPSALNLTNKILVKFTPFLSMVSFLDSDERGLVVNILSLLPMLFESYDEPSEMHLECADSIAAECNKMADSVAATAQSRPTTSASVLSVSASQLEGDPNNDDTISITSTTTGSSNAVAAAWNNLATVMRMFSRQSDVKDSVSWLAAVCQYLGDAVHVKLVSLVGYLSELLERGPTSYQNCLLHMICSFIQIIDLQKLPKERFNTTTVHTLLHRFMLQSNPEWKSALSALKLIVTRSSTLCSPSSSQRRVQQITSSIEDAVIVRRQIPGRTLSFNYNFPVPPIGGSASVAQTLANLATSRSVPSATAPNGSNGSVQDANKVLTTPPRRKSVSDAQGSDAEGGRASKANLTSRTSAEFNSGKETKQAVISERKPAAANDTSSASSNATAQSTVVSRSPSIALGRQVSVGNASVSTDSQNSNWRRPFNSQRRVRDKLTGVIRSFGRTPATLARTPSVVFSSTTEVDFQTVVSVNSNIGAGTVSGYESQIQSHPASSMGMGNGDSTPAAGGTTGHGSIDDMNSIGPGGMELGTPSGREDTISLDVFAEFDFLNDFSDYDDDNKAFSFGLRPSESSMAAYGPTPIDITSTHPLTPNLRTSTSGVQLHHQSSSSVNKQLLFTPHVGDVMSAVVGVCGADNDQNSDQEETDQTLISTNINDGHPQTVVPHDGVALEQSSDEDEGDIEDDEEDLDEDDDDEEDEDIEEDSEDDVVHEDDSVSEPEQDEVSSPEDNEGEFGGSGRRDRRSGTVDSEMAQEEMEANSGDYNDDIASPRTFSDRFSDIVRSFRPEDILILEPQTDMVDIRVLTITLPELHVYWTETVNDLLAAPNQGHEGDRGTRGRLMMEQGSLNVNTMPSLYLFISRFIQEYSIRGYAMLSRMSDFTASTSEELRQLFVHLKTCFDTLLSAHKSTPVVMIGSAWKHQVCSCVESGRQRRKVEKSVRQCVLESSEAVAILNNTLTHTSPKVAAELRRMREAVLDASFSSSSYQSQVDQQGTKTTSALLMDMFECLVRAHMQLSLLLNQIDKLYSIVTECNESALAAVKDASERELKILDVSKNVSLLAEFLRGGGYNDGSSTTPHRLQRYLESHSADGGRSNDEILFEMLKQILAKKVHPSEEDLLDAAFISNQIRAEERLNKLPLLTPPRHYCLHPPTALLTPPPTPLSLTPSLSISPPILDVSKNVSLLAEFLRGGGYNDGSSTTPHRLQRYLESHSADGGRSNDEILFEMLKQILAKKVHPSEEDLLDAAFISNRIRCSLRSTEEDAFVNTSPNRNLTYSRSADKYQSGQLSQFLVNSADRSILLALVWNFALHHKCRGQSAAIGTFACSMMDDEATWLDCIDQIGSNSARLRSQLETLRLTTESSSPLHNRQLSGTRRSAFSNDDVSRSTDFMHASTSRDPAQPPSSYFTRTQYEQRSRNTSRSDRFSTTYTDEESTSNTTVVSYL